MSVGVTPTGGSWVSLHEAAVTDGAEDDQIWMSVKIAPAIVESVRYRSVPATFRTPFRAPKKVYYNH